MSDKATEFQQYVKYVQNLNIDGIQLREELVAVDAVIDEGSERLSLLHEQREQVDKRLDQVKAQQNRLVSLSIKPMLDVSVRKNEAEDKTTYHEIDNSSLNTESAGIDDNNGNFDQDSADTTLEKATVPPAASPSNSSQTYGRTSSPDSFVTPKSQLSKKRSADDLDDGEDQAATNNSPTALSMRPKRAAAARGVARLKEMEQDYPYPKTNSASKTKTPTAKKRRLETTSTANVALPFVLQYDDEDDEEALPEAKIADP